MKTRTLFYLAIIRSMLYLFALCCAIATAASAQIPSQPDTLTFIHVTDPHICDLTGYHPFFVQLRRHYGNNRDRFTAFLKSVPKSYGADFVIITGDNIDFFEAETDRKRMLGTQIEQYNRLLDLSDVPVYLTLGNHDIASYWVNSDSINTKNTHQVDAERARATWIRNASCFKDGAYYNRGYHIDSTFFRLLWMDNSYYSPAGASDGLLSFVMDPAQLCWLDDQLRASPSDVEVIFMHMPLPYGKSPGPGVLCEPIGNYSAKSGYYNLASVLEKNSSTRLIFAGHEHINSINKYLLPNGNTLTQVRTAAFGRDPDNWRLIKMTHNSIIICFPGSSKIELIVPMD